MKNYNLMIYFILLTLFIINIFIGDFPLKKLVFPYNFLILTELILLILFLKFLLNKNKLVLYLKSKKFAIFSMYLVLFFILMISFIPQETSQNKIIILFNFNKILLSWHFAFSIFLLLISLGLTILNRTNFKIYSNIQFFLLHFGLWIVIAVSFLSYPDKKKLVMQIKENEVVWYAKNQFNQFEEIPFAIKIKKLNANYYFDSIKKIYEPSNYSSEILLFTKSDTIAQDRIISVNNPIYAEGWNIYLNSIDKKNNISTYLIVYDKYYFIIVIGLIMFVLGSILLIYTKLLNFTK